MKYPRRTTNHLPLLGMMIGMGLCVLACVYTLIENDLPVDAPFTEFQDIQPETPLEKTYYQIDYTHQNIDLKNTVSQATQSILAHYSPVALPPAYQLLRYDNSIYLLIRLASGGNSGAYWFKLFNVSVFPAVDLMQHTVAPLSGLSCTNPYLDVNALVFEFSPNCADPPRSRQTYQIVLN